MTATTRRCECGKPYEDTAAGRWTHRTQQGHTPAPPRSVEPREGA